MAGIRHRPAFGEFCRLLDTGGAGGPTDAQLLRRFAAHRDGDAFAALVGRHGPVVLGVCRQVLGNADDADDAFQATFLLLARRAGAIRTGEAVGGWLYRVAYRVATKARTAMAQRRRQPPPATDRTPPDPSSEAAWRELQAILQQELARLPDKYRAPFILCCLEGKTGPQAARCLGWKEGTVTGRLSQARRLLERRLARRGIALPAVLCAAALAREAGATVPAKLATATAEAALAFAAGRLTASAVSAGAVALARAAGGTAMVNVPAVIVVLAAAGLLAGVGLAARRTTVKPPAEPVPVVGAAADAPGRPNARTDRYGDPLPAGALQRLGTVRFRHGGQVFALARSPDGRVIASGGNGGVIRLWDAESGKPRGSLHGHAIWVFAVGFSRDGKRLVSAGGEDANHDHGKAVVWDLASGRALWTIDSTTSVRTAAFSPDAKQVAVGSDDGRLLLLDAATGKELHSLGSPRNRPMALAFAPDGRTLAASGDGQCTQLWDLVTLQPGRKLPRAPRSLTFSPDGRTLASGHDGPGLFDGPASVCLWDVATGRKRHTLGGLKQTAFSVAFSADGKQLAAGDGAGTVRLWDVRTGREVRTIRPSEGSVHALLFGPDGQTLTVGSTDGLLHVWDLAKGAERFPFEGHTAGLARVALAAGGRALASTGADRTVRLWDLRTGRQTAVLRGHVKGVYSVSCAGGGNRMATGGGDGSVRIWDVAAAREVRCLPPPGPAWDSRVAYSPSGRLLATGNVDLIRLWDARNGREIRQLKGHDGYVVGLAFSSDERLLASVSHGYSDGKQAHEDRGLRLWDLATGTELRRWPGRYPDTPAFRPDGRQVACLDEGRLHAWDTTTGRERPLVPETDLTAFAFSPDGRWLATGHRRGPLRVREVATGGRVLAFDTAPVDAQQLIWAADGRTLIAANADGTVLVWDLAPPGWDSARGAVPSLERAWADLGTRDAGQAYRAVWTLVEGGNAAVALLARRLKPAPAGGEAARMSRLVADLDHDAFARREAASRELGALGRAAEPALLRALTGHPTAELRTRAEALLDQIARGATPPTADELRATRALAVLERIATPEARRLLADLADGAPHSRLTWEAQSSAARLTLSPPERGR